MGFVRDKSLPGTTGGMDHVCAFRHALALDERRVKFLPEFSRGGLGPLGLTDKSPPKVKEVWFAGSHSDMYAAHSLYVTHILTLSTVAAETSRMRNWIILAQHSDG